MINERNRNWALSARTAGVCRCGPLFCLGGEWDDVAKPGKRDIATAVMGPRRPRPESRRSPAAGRRAGPRMRRLIGSESRTQFNSYDPVPYAEQGI